MWYTPEGPVHFIQKASRDSFLWNSGIAVEDKKNDETKPCWKNQWRKEGKNAENIAYPTAKQLLFAESLWAITFTEHGQVLTPGL